MNKPLFTPEETREIAVQLLYCASNGKSLTQEQIDYACQMFNATLEKIMERRKKPKDDYPYLISEDELRTVFEAQHRGRDLTRGRFGTYRSAQIAAIWNQHLATARLIEKLLREKLQ